MLVGVRIPVINMDTAKNTIRIHWRPLILKPL
nr:MAG TPA: hypothetical protein [Caudoviricetes sp.]